MGIPIGTGGVNRRPFYIGTLKIEQQNPKRLGICRKKRAALRVNPTRRHTYFFLICSNCSMVCRNLSNPNIAA